MGITSAFKTSERIDAKTKGEISTWTQVYRVEADTDHTPNELLLEFVGGLPPELRSRPFTSDKRWIVRDVQFAPVDYRVWDCTVTLVTRLTTNVLPSDSDLTFGNKQWWTMSRRVTAVTTDWWIKPTTLPTNFDATWPPSAVIGGSKIDLAGIPYKQPMWRHEVFLTTFFERAYQKSVSANNWSAYAYFNIANAINKRNSAAFLSYPVGQIALIGFDEQPSEDPWQSVTLRFIATEYGHLEQRPIGGPDGKILLTSTATYAGKTIKQNDAAFWYQPYESKFDFTTLSDFSEITSPTPTW